MNIVLDPNKMNALGIGINEIATAIKMRTRASRRRRQNQEKELTVQVKGRLKDEQDFRRLIIGTRGGQPVYLEQVAQVEDGIAEKKSAAMTDGQPTLSITIIKSSGTNTLEVADNVRTQMAQLQKACPQTSRFPPAKTKPSAFVPA